MGDLMERSEVERLIDNEREWRKHILSRMEKHDAQLDILQETATTLKVKIGFIGTIFGFLGGIIGIIIEKVALK
jgi:hypothetical protein